MKKLMTALMVASMAAGALGMAGAAIAQPGPHHGWNNAWSRGHRIDRNDWRRARVVNWRARHLRAPPPGYEWRYVDGRYVLAAVATGLIADIILNSR